MQEKLPLLRRRHHRDADQTDSGSKIWPTGPVIHTEVIGGFSKLELIGRNPYQFDGDANDVAQDGSAVDDSLKMLAPSDHRRIDYTLLSKHRKKDSGYSSLSSTFSQNNGMPENEL